MGSVTQNKAYYSAYDWRYGGAEWSALWGSTQAMWNYSIAPRIGSYLPTARVVEIGAGHGRIARHLIQYTSERLYLFDIMESCVHACIEKFNKDSKVICTQNDGVSLPNVEDNSIDLIVSFYSLVHADYDTIAAYTSEFDRVLKKDGVVFLHHSNAGIYFDAQAALIDKRMRLLAVYRDISMTAERMQEIANKHHLTCVHQECINWDVNEALTDCFSTIVRKDSKWERNPNLVLNLGFCREMKLAAAFNRSAPRYGHNTIRRAL